MKVNCEEIQNLLTPTASEQGLEIVEVLFKMSKNPSLTIFIDKEGGVDLDSCEKFHNAIDPILDELNPTGEMPYTLNVSSPGLDRPFKTDKDYLKNIGEMVECKLFSAMQGKKLIEGKLLSYDGNSVEIEDGKKTLKINKNQIAKINLLITI